MYKQFCFVFLLSEDIKALWRDHPYIMITVSSIYWLLIITITCSYSLQTFSGTICPNWGTTQLSTGGCGRASPPALQVASLSAHPVVWALNQHQAAPSHLLRASCICDVSSVHSNCLLTKNGLCLNVCLFQEIYVQSHVLPSHPGCMLPGIA